MMMRITTGGVLKNYRSNLRSSFITLDKARNSVLTQRNFNSFSEDPAAATQAFQLRRAWWRTESQYTNSQSTIHKFNSAWNALDSVEEMVDTKANNSALSAVLTAADDSHAGGRAALGAELEQLAQSIVQAMNCQYGDNFVFSGADGHNVPFEWGDNGELLYRGVDVTNGDINILTTLAEEANYVDIGLGLKEDGQGQLIESSAFNASLTGISFLGYGTDGDGDSKNIACIIKEMGELLSACDGDGKWASDTDEDRYRQLMEKLETASDELKSNYVQMDTKAAFLENNHAQLENSADTLNEQFLEIEQVDLADAITSFSWAQYCYNAALKVGNSILSESLMDYLN